jgi:divalent metal cation (Fe/Co/Zn/Cd) transporter
MTTISRPSQDRLWQYALWLAIFTVGYNLLEGVVSVYFGVQDEALTLFGFGIDSFIEVISGLGILTMVLRIQRNPGTSRSGFERTALRVTGISFYVLGVSLAATAVYNLIIGHKPETTLPGIVIALVSIAVMWVLVWGKRRTGVALSCSPILADANCTMVCIYMSVVLLAASLIYQLTGFGFVDSLGAVGLIYYSVREGRESFEKAAGLDDDAD